MYFFEGVFPDSSSFFAEPAVVSAKFLLE